MSPGWRPEIVVHPEAARSLICSQFPEVRVQELRLLGEGWDNTAYLVNRRLVFRFPRREVACVLIRIEIGLLPGICGELPLAVPVPIYAGAPADGYPWPFAGYRLIPGRSASDLGLSYSARSKLAAPLGKFLAALHAIPLERARGFGVRVDRLARMDVARRVNRALAFLDSEAASFSPDSIARLRRLAQAAPVGYRAAANCLAHGDLYSRHLLIGSRGELSGIIDWGDAHIGDRAVDLSSAHSFLPGSAHGDFLRSYGAVAEEVWMAARCRALWHTLYVWEYARSIADQGLLNEANTALRLLSSEAGPAGAD